MSARADVHLEVIERALLDGVHPFVGEPERERVDLGLVPVFRDERPLLGLAGLIDWRSSGCLSAIVRSGFCTSELGEQLLVPCDRRLPVDRLVLVGLGSREAFDGAKARTLGAQLVKISVGLRAETVLIALPVEGMERALVEALVEGLLAAIESEPNRDTPDEPTRDDDEASEAAPESQERRTPPRWWLAADDAVVARLRRVLAGPPRPARSGPGLHT